MARRKATTRKRVDDAALEPTALPISLSHLRSLNLRLPFPGFVLTDDEAREQPIAHGAYAAAAWPDPVALENALLTWDKAPAGCDCGPEDVFGFYQWVNKGYMIRKGEHGVRVPTEIVSGKVPANQREGFTVAMFCRCQVDRREDFFELKRLRRSVECEPTFAAMAFGFLDQFHSSFVYSQDLVLMMWAAYWLGHAAGRDEAAT